MQSQQFDPKPLLRSLADAGVDFVVIGGVAGGAHGSAFSTFDLDVAYGHGGGNLERLGGVLTEIGATLRGAPPGLPFAPDAATLSSGSHFTFDTPYGAFDILSDPDGAPPYDVLRARAVPIEVDGRRVLVASLDDLIAMKRASGRPKDKAMEAEYILLSDRIRAPKA